MSSYTASRSKGSTAVCLTMSISSCLGILKRSDEDKITIITHDIMRVTRGLAGWHSNWEKGHTIMSQTTGTLSPQIRRAA
ncbi:hypothetical protein P154DRAFT_366457 [Amniculicola lignicola CBS 123094]|uniref:Uncharacterized protein n=1 Tax=Amniculicola lignicola CBS 123094 TaxID=1392246 RepID=A0A6A5W065_9PLEO|nr:hypothetical protein P154DRAFT_366457 [Amniculicola lignicola CBS 123094]